MKEAYYELLVAFLWPFLICYTCIRLLTDLAFVASWFVAFGIPLAIVLSVHRIRVRRPDPDQVEAFFSDTGSKSSVTQSVGGTTHTSCPLNVMAHRSACMDAPENSLVGLHEMKKHGCSIVEFDVALTSDGVPVIFHDDAVDRITEGTGLLEKMTWEEAKRLDIAVHHPHRDVFGAVRMPTLNDMIEECLKLDIRMFMDIKAYDTRIIKILLAAYQQYPELHYKAFVSSFWPQVIYRVRRSDPKIMCSIAWRPYFFSYLAYSGSMGGLTPRFRRWYQHWCTLAADKVLQWAVHDWLHYVLGLSAVLMHKDEITLSLVRHYEKKNVRVVAWTVNNPVEKFYFDKRLHVPYMTDTLVNYHPGAMGDINVLAHDSVC